MARQIVISEAAFERIFDKALEQFKHEHPFMEPEETVREFQGSRSYRLLVRVRGALQNLKKELEEADV